LKSKSIIVSDATSLIVLDKLRALDLLCKLFEQVLVPQVVLAEVTVDSSDFADRARSFTCLESIDVQASSRLSSLMLLLDEGEANAIEAAARRELPLIIDERKGRRIAQQMGIRVIGFAGLLIQARRRKILDRTAALGLLDRSMENGMRLSESLYLQVTAVLKADSGES
jgi:predicted nucleic acid-binding protein